MDHDVVVRQQMTEKYLLDELDPAAREEFEEHFFDCQECAADVHAGALFVEQSKIVLTEKSEPIPYRLSANDPAADKPGWLAGLGVFLRPAFTLPVMALLLAVIGYQTLVAIPLLANKPKGPQILQWVQLNIATAGSADQVITLRPGDDFLLFVRIPPAGDYSHYTTELHNPAGKVEWSLTIPATPGKDVWPIPISGANLAPGSYTLAAHGVTATGETQNIGQASFELQIRK